MNWVQDSLRTSINREFAVAVFLPEARVKSHREHLPHGAKPSILTAYSNHVLSKLQKQRFAGVYDRIPDSGDRFYEGGIRTKAVRMVDALSSALPLVTVVTVVLNNEKTIRRCLESVFAQSYPNIEYVVIDGGSTDGTLDIIRENIGRIDYAISEKDGGIYAAMNKGIRLARGEYVALINSDDWLEPDGIRLSIDNLLANDAEVSIGHAKVWLPDGTLSHIWNVGNFDVRTLVSGISFCHQAVIVSAHAYDVVGPYDEVMRISSDYKWAKAVFCSGLKVVFTREDIVNFSFDGVSVNNRPIWKEECKRMLCAQFPTLDYADVSAFLEYVYRDAAFDPHAYENLIGSAVSDPALLQALALTLKDKFAQTHQESAVPPAERVRLKPMVSARPVSKPPARPTFPRVVKYLKKRLKRIIPR